MTALAVTGIIASGFLSALGDVLLSALHVTDVILGYFTMTALATLPLASAIGRRLKRQEALTLVVVRKAEVGDDTLAMLCPCCTSWSDDCICTADCGVPRCQMADPEVSRG